MPELELELELEKYIMQWLERLQAENPVDVRTLQSELMWVQAEIEELLKSQ
jgi:hypothetical protein